MKAHSRLETCSNTGALWQHKYFLKAAFYLERFRTRLMRLSRLLVFRLFNNFYFAHNGSNYGVLQAYYTFTLACCNSN